MSSTSGGPSTFTKMRQVYWEAKQSFNKSLGQREDSFIISSDNNLDTKIELLQAADRSFDALTRVILKYRSVLQDLVDVQENFGLLLIEYGTKDSTAAGKIMCMSGKALSKAAQKQIRLKINLMNIFYEVQTFQFKATADVLQTITKMEKARKSYRSGLMWLKNESTNLDPDVCKKLKSFRKVQEHIKRLKVKFDGVKLESMQKIDLFLLSRSNLFSNTLIPYSKTFKKICKHTAVSMDYTLKNIPLCLSYNFVALKELNKYSSILQNALQKEQSSRKMPKNQKNINPIEKSKSFSIASVESTNIHPITEHLSCSKESKNDSGKCKNIKNNISECLQPNKSPKVISLIDLNGEADRQASTKLFTENKDLPCFKYSDDLLSINFDNYRTVFESELFADKMEKIFEHSLEKSDSQANFTRETGELKYWSLIQNYDQTSKFKKLNNAEKDDLDLTYPKHSSSKPLDPKWDDILIQFDPFLENIIDRKVKTDSLEPC